MFPGSMVEQSPRLSTLVEDPRIVGACTSLLGAGYTFYGGDGNFYSGDTSWHSDTQAIFGMGAKSVCKHLKIAFYLDAVSADCGSLRVIPGSHLIADEYAQSLESEEGRAALNRMGAATPAVALATTPGDLVLFDHRLKHASFGGGPRRRMFTLNLYSATGTEAEYSAAQQVNASYYEPATPKGADGEAAARDKRTALPFKDDWFERSPPARRAILANHVKLWGEMVRQHEAGAGGGAAGGEPAARL
jgi:ectoine hydroxylase-related dioxygenase (phytanoyl-CoA dioxygenase family)